MYKRGYGLYIYGVKPEKCKKWRQTGKEKNRSMPQITFLSHEKKTLKYLRKQKTAVFLNCRSRKPFLKSCGKTENTRKTVKSGGNRKQKNFCRSQKQTPSNNPSYYYSVLKIPITRLPKATFFSTGLHNFQAMSPAAGVWAKFLEFSTLT